MQLPFPVASGTFARYLEQIWKVFFKIWPKPCPLCGAVGCATFLGYYIRVRVYFGDTVYVAVKIARFLCNRLYPVPPGTHRTFSLLPSCLIPYVRHSIDMTLEVAEMLSKNDENAYQTSRTLASRYENPTPVPATSGRIKDQAYEAIGKLNRLPQELQEMIDWSACRATLSGLISFAKNYRSRILSGAKGVYALCYDWFYLFLQDLPFMQRGFLFGTPSQKRLA